MDLLTYEWRRARSIRTTWITSLFVILSVVGFSYLISIAGTDADGNPVKVPAAEVVSQSVLGNPIVMVLVASLGAMAFGHEYRYGTIRLTLTAFPRRTGVFFAKLLTTLLIPLLVLAVAVAASYGLLVALGSGGHRCSRGPGDPWTDALWQMAVFVLHLRGLGLLPDRDHPQPSPGDHRAVAAVLGGDGADRDARRAGSTGCRRCLPLSVHADVVRGEDVALVGGRLGGVDGGSAGARFRAASSPGRLRLSARPLLRSDQHQLQDATIWSRGLRAVTTQRNADDSYARLSH